MESESFKDLLLRLNCRRNWYIIDDNTYFIGKYMQIFIALIFYNHYGNCQNIQRNNCGIYWIFTMNMHWHRGLVGYVLRMLCTNDVMDQ